MSLFKPMFLVNWLDGKIKYFVLGVLAVAAIGIVVVNAITAYGSGWRDLAERYTSTEAVAYTDSNVSLLLKKPLGSKIGFVRAGLVRLDDNGLHIAVTSLMSLFKPALSLPWDIVASCEQRADREMGDQIVLQLNDPEMTVTIEDASGDFYQACTKAGIV